MNEEIEIEIDAAGKVTIQTKGIKGSSCLDAIAALVRIIGREESKELTAEFHEPALGQERIAQHLQS